MAHGHMGRAFLTEQEKAERPKVTRALLKRVFSYLKPYSGFLFLALICIAGASACSLLPSILTGKIIDEGLIGRNLHSLIFFIGLSLGVTLLANLIGVAESYINTWIAQHITYDMRNEMYRHLQKMDQGFFTTNSQGDIITRMTSDIDGVERVVSTTFSNILTNITTLIIALVAMYQKNWILATLGIAVVPLFVIPTRKAGKVRWTLTREAQECNDEINGILNETLSVSGQLLVKLFCREKYEYTRYEEANHRMIRLNIRESMAGRWFRVVLSTFASIGPMLLYLVGGVLMTRYDSSLTVGDITVLVALLGKMYMPANSLLNIQVDWIRSMALFTRIFAYYDMPIVIDDSEDARTLKDAKGNVEFRHVGFAYDKDRPILKDINFKVEPGKSVAIVGPSGAGKSTIINLIPRLYDAESGEVLFDGINVKDIRLKDLRDNIGVVSQDVYLFNGTIRENLLYARQDASEEELIDACKRANIYDFIEKQEKKLDALVGNRGLKLSGGEKQRVAIARMLLKDPALLILDEATSSLDSISEAKIQEAIEPIIRSRTSILIAHRLSTILAADEILVVEAGEIVERGSHESLLKESVVYKELYETQFKINLTDEAEDLTGNGG